MQGKQVHCNDDGIGQGLCAPLHKIKGVKKEEEDLSTTMVGHLLWPKKDHCITKCYHFCTSAEPLIKFLAKHVRFLFLSCLVISM